MERVNQQVVFIEANRKRGLLTELFADATFSRVLVFTRTKRGADQVARILEGGGVNASAIHGNKSQNQRERALAAFKAGEVRALVATDIAARGIDISSVTHVVQYELPDVPEQYVHRIGRTARAGADGSAVAFCAEDERSLLRDIEKVTRQKIPSIDRRNDPALAQLSLNANIEAKRGARAEPRGEPQPHRQQKHRRPEHVRNGGRNEARGEQRHRAEAPERVQHEQRGQGDGRSRGRRGKGGSPGWSGVAKPNGHSHKPQGDKNRGQKSANHRKGQNRPQQAARGDVMKVAAGPSGPVTPADALMKHLSSTNPWSKA
ncbi:MAG TPA: helicase-related protein [Hyphomonadaceae bacterium]